MNTQIEIGKLWARTDAKTGRQILSGKFGFDARLRIEELAEPDPQTKATHVIFVLPPFVKRDDESGQNTGQRWQGTNTPDERQQSQPAQPARTFGFAEESE